DSRATAVDSEAVNCYRRLSMMREITKMTRHLPSLITLCFLAICCSGTNAVAEGIYGFIDANGVPNFSNVAHDPRYKKLHVMGQPVVRLRPAPSAKMVRQAIADNSQQHRVVPAVVRCRIKAEAPFTAD